jgi:hypothetical protein
MLRRLAVMTGLLFAVLAVAAVAYPGATLTSSDTTITVGNLDCGTNYEIRVREFRSGAWRDQNTYTKATAACATPSPTPTATATATPPPAPAANFSVDPNPAVRNQATTFTSTGSCPSTPCSYVWVHGDAASTDQIGTGQTASFTYTGPAGTRTVTLKVTDSLSRTGTKTTTFDLVEAAATPTPTPTATPSVTPTPTPEPGSWPDASSTGPSGTLTPASGMTITQAGAVIDSRDISGQVVVNAPNVTIRNSRIRSTAFRPVQNNSTGLLLEDVEIDGLDANGDCFGSSGATLRRVELWNCENGMNVSGTVTVEDSWIHDLDTDNSAHTDGAQFNQGASDIIFRHNVIDPVPGTGGATSPIIMWDEADPQNNRVWIENNRLLGQGASFTIYTARECCGTDVYIRNNRMQEGVFGYNGGSASNVTEWSGNVDDSTGQPVGG